MSDILVVEKDEAIRELVYKVLSDMGHTVREAANGAGAIRLCRHHEFDLIIMDCPMSFALLEASRRSDGNPSAGVPPFILHTSDYDNQELRNSALNAGALDVIGKVGNIKTFRQAINQLLEKVE